MPPTATSEDIKHELKATLAARRDVGADYDDHFVESFMDKLKAQVVQEMRQDARVARAQSRPVMTVQGRLTVALVSMVLILVVFGIGFIWPHPSYDAANPLGWSMILSTLIILVNLALNVRLRVKQ